MKKLFTLFFLSTLILTSCSKEDSNINLSNPLANTTWKVKTYGQVISKDLDGVAKSDFISAMFNNSAGNQNFHFLSESAGNSNSFLNFSESNSTTNRGPMTWTHSSSNHCSVDTNTPQYSYEELEMYDSNSLPSNALALNINEPNLLYVYIGLFGSISNGNSDPKAVHWKFTVYELTSEIPPTCPSGSNTLPNADHLVGNWDIEISFDNIPQSTGKIIIESAAASIDPSMNNYLIKGKFLEEIDGQVTEYNITGRDYDPYHFDNLNIVATNGTDTFSFSGQINTEGKFVGIYGDNSVNLNGDLLGNFIATKN